MKAVITPEYYFTKEILEKEYSSIFKGTWSFAGFKRDLQNPNDFITLNISGIPVVVQNFKGVIKAFKNVCSHRFSIIQTEKKGNRVFMCPYHGWAYDDKGIPAGIPKKPLFQFTQEDLECLKLHEYSIQSCGQLVFVNVSANTQSLQQYLGAFYGQIESISDAFGELIDVNEIDIKANWKVVVENTLESYHVNLIHKDSFRKLGATGIEFNFDHFHSEWNADLKFKELDDALKVINKPYQNRPYKIPGYKHLLIFPNVLISTTYGISFNLSHVVPIDEDTTRFVSYVFMTTKTEEKRKGALEEEYEKSLVEFNRTVFDEDKFICQQVQVGVKHSSYSGELSEEEGRVCKFQKNYNKLMNS